VRARINDARQGRSFVAGDFLGVRIPDRLGVAPRPRQRS
jgi:hypothetical protein